MAYMSALDYGQPPVAAAIQSNIRQLLAHLLASPRFKVGWTASVSGRLLACHQSFPTAAGGRVQLASQVDPQVDVGVVDLQRKGRGGRRAGS